MDLSNFTKSLSQMVTHEIYRDCSTACFSDQGEPDKTCVKNCSAKHVQFLAAFGSITSQEIPKLQANTQ